MSYRLHIGDQVLSKDLLIDVIRRRFEELGVDLVKIELNLDPLGSGKMVLSVQDKKKIAWATTPPDVALGIPLMDFVDRYLQPAIVVCKQHLEE